MQPLLAPILKPTIPHKSNNLCNACMHPIRPPFKVKQQNGCQSDAQYCKDIYCSSKKYKYCCNRWVWVRATSHTSRDLWPWNCEIPTKVRPNTPPKSCSVVMDLQVHCEVICDRGPSTKRYFNEFLFMRVLIHDKIE